MDADLSKTVCIVGKAGGKKKKKMVQDIPAFAAAVHRNVRGRTGRRT